ncbi:hypothetical protein ACODT3_38445 [Streptomyces sp. 4.24]|uniref:hypothetical protein n=1 Tax=Streptomyces tritrimontium TaxID=3406573 RepID=UPI003BB53625
MTTSIPWQSSATVLEQIMGRYGVVPGRAGGMQAAWSAFEEFVQIPVEGIEGPEKEGDCFIIEWGAWDWTGGRPAVSLGRLLAVTEQGDESDEYGQPQYWKVEFQASFADDPAWASLSGSGAGDSGFDGAEIGLPRAAALADTRRLIEQEPLLRAMWRSAPIDIEVTLDHAG